MARQNTSGKLATLQKQQAELTAKLKEAKAKADAETKETQRRKHELAGGIILKACEDGSLGDFGNEVTRLLLYGLTKTADRALFGFKPLTKAERAENEKLTAALPKAAKAAGGSTGGG